MKFRVLLLVASLTASFQAVSQTPRNCSQILAINPTAVSGVYTIDPDGPGPKASISCYCDMTTNGGGWVLLLNYNHLEATNPSLKVRTDSLPLQGATALGVDESNTAYWGHADTSLANAIPFDEIRFYGITSAHNRIIDFKTTHTGTISYFKTGLGSTEGISSDFSPLPAHSAMLPASINFTVSNRGNFAMTDYPLWTGSAYHWFLGGSDVSCTLARWEVDDYPCFTQGIIPATFHQIWARQSNPTGLKDATSSEMHFELWPNPASESAILKFNYDNQKPSTLAIYSSTGQLLRSEPLVFNLPQIDLSGLGNGIYFFLVTTSQKVQAQ